MELKKVWAADFHPCHVSYFSRDSVHLTMRHKFLFNIESLTYALQTRVSRLEFYELKYKKKKKRK